MFLWSGTSGDLPLQWQHGIFCCEISWIDQVFYFVNFVCDSLCYCIGLERFIFILKSHMNIWDTYEKDNCSQKFSIVPISNQPPYSKVNQRLWAYHQMYSRKSLKDFLIKADCLDENVNINEETELVVNYWF